MIFRFVKLYGTAFVVIAVLCSILFLGLGFPCAQYPAPQPYPQGPPMGRQPQPNQQPQQPLEYAFRPNLSNPEYGECLNLEKNWKNLWQTYYQLYNQTRMMNPSDPQYAQMANYVNHMKMRLDAAWADFSGRCVYFPNHR
jgi:hypothetical protein